MELDWNTIITIVAVVFVAGINYARLLHIEERLKTIEELSERVIKLETKMAAIEKSVYQ
jgi:hypothetical protein